MAGVPRLCVVNRIQAAATVLTASSSAIGSPVSRLKDQLRSKTWRSPVGWTIDSNNNRLDFKVGSTSYAATIASGTYATGAALATAIVAAMEAQYSSPVWGCSYNEGSWTNKFAIWSDVTFSLLWNTGANKAVSIGKCIGFNVSADDTGGTSYIADDVSFQSRHWLIADLGASLPSVQAGIVINHNSGTGGIYYMNGFNASWGGLFTQLLSGDANIRIAYLSSLYTPRYLVLVIEDVQNPVGYGEVGIWYAGPYAQPSWSYAIGLEKAWQELSEVTVAIPGAHFVDEKARRPTWSLSWLELPEADRATLAAAFALVPKGRNFFFSFNAVATPTNTEYVYLMEGVRERLTAGLYFDVPVPLLAGALG